MRIFFGAILALFLSIPAVAHDHDHPELNQWMRGLANQNHIPCCSGSDAQPVADPDWIVDPEGHYMVRLGGIWHPVPDSAVINEPNKDGRTLLWLGMGGMSGPGPVYIRCFLPGAGV